MGSARESSGEDASEHPTSARSLQLDVKDMTGHSDNRSNYGGNAEHEDSARKQEKQGGKHAHGKCPDLAARPRRLGCRVLLELGRRKPVEAAGVNNVKAKFVTIYQTDPLELFGNQFGIQRMRP